MKLDVATEGLQIPEISRNKTKLTWFPWRTPFRRLRLVFRTEIQKFFVPLRDESKEHRELCHSVINVTHGKAISYLYHFRGHSNNTCHFRGGGTMGQIRKKCATTKNHLKVKKQIALIHLAWIVHETMLYSKLLSFFE